MSDNLNHKIVNASKWSAIAEVMAKLITPITAMVLARLLTPEAFGIVATLTMVITFAEIFSDAGFQRYLIQRQFSDSDDRDKDTNVAFWSNLIMSFLIWGIIALFKEPIAVLVGNPGMGNVLVIACASIPLAGFSSIQMALFKKDLDFKTLFWRRLVAILIPVFITIPLAFILRSYWSLVFGTIAVNIANAVLLSIKSTWHPKRYYSFRRLKHMFAFCSWSITDSVLVWLTSYADIFFIGKVLSQYYLGLYKTSTSMVGHMTELITSLVLPVVMPSLSKLQNDVPAMRILLLRFQKVVSIALMPLGVGMFMFRYLITDILLGSQWIEVADFLGLWGLMSTITIVFARFCSPVYPAIGKPRISAIVQISHLVVLIPAIILSGQYGFQALYVTRSLIRLELVLVNLVAVYIIINQSPWKMLMNIMPESLCALIMGFVAYILLAISHNIVWQFVSIILCAIIYFMALYYIFPNERETINRLSQLALKTFKRK